MTYKYTRKERIAKYMGDSHYELTQLLKDLLAQKEDRKECKHQYLLKQDHCYCVVCGKSTKPTPSPLEGFEEIEEIKGRLGLWKDQEVEILSEEKNKINSLIRNQKLIIQRLNQIK